MTVWILKKLRRFVWKKLQFVFTFFLKLKIEIIAWDSNGNNFPGELKKLRRNPPEIWVTSGQKPSTKITGIYIVLQTYVGLF